MKDHVFHKVAEIVEFETGVDLTEVDPEVDLRSQVNVDSMQYVAISVAIEDALGIELPIAIMKARTLAEIMKVVRTEVARSVPLVSSAG